jgi:RecB family exonuclease
MGFAARVGTAFHKTLEALGRHPPRGKTLAAVADDARQRFSANLELQEREAARRPREARMPREQRRIERAAEAAIIEAQRIASHPARMEGDLPLSERTADSAAVATELEVPVTSADGLFHGRIDRVERDPSGARLIDYKSAVRFDLPERYERQLQLYALMWHDTRGEWPIEAAVVYPLMPLVHSVDVDASVCREVARQSAELAVALHVAAMPESLASPGDVCQVCEFRPWCKPFWRWQSTEPSSSVALERAHLGIEGTITTIVQQSERVLAQIAWRDAQIRLNADLTVYPQLRNAAVGTKLRVLGARLQGLRHEPRGMLSEGSEIFLVR